MYLTGAWEQRDHRELGNPCRLLKLRQIGTLRLHMKGVLPCWFVGLIVRVQKIFVLPWLLESAQYEILFSSPNTFSLISHHRPATCSGSRAGSPVSVSLPGRTIEGEGCERVEGEGEGGLYHKVGMTLFRATRK